jgi:predicted SAM-dependent methyltransferase
MLALNCGSGQRPFDPAFGWINIDINPRWNPQIVANWTDLPMFKDNSVDIVVSHHSLEHSSREESDAFVKEAYRILRPAGSLIVIVPEPKSISLRYAYGQIDETTFNFLTYGAYMGHESDRHKQAWSPAALLSYLSERGPWRSIKAYDWRPIPGADIAAWDWWFHGVEAIK